MNIAENFEQQSKDIPYSPHNSFKGVSLKHLVRSAGSEGQISCHLVKVEPFCSLETHAHEKQLEIHEVILGAGECRIAEKQTAYTPGTVAVIPQGTLHSVTAGADGLYILAKFTPPLL